jgi:hypothetical protein
VRDQLTRNGSRSSGSTRIFALARFLTSEPRRPIVVVTNQSGIGRGYFDENTYAELTRLMCDRFTPGQKHARGGPGTPVYPWRTVSGPRAKAAVTDFGLGSEWSDSRGYSDY